jgi:C1A family cysteine protease
MSEKVVRRYGYIPDIGDHRDKRRAYKLADFDTPPKVDLREKMPEVYDQGHLGSCTANALAGAYQYTLIKEVKEVFMPSRLFIYFSERQMEGTVGVDAGAQIRDGIKSLADRGVCDEAIWPYLVDRFTTKPPTLCYTEAMKHKVATYERIDQSRNFLKATLAKGFPVVFGFTVYESFEAPEVARTGIVPMPGMHEPVLGGHAVLLVGYDDDTSKFIVRNSWGPHWGDKGYCYFDYEYLIHPDLAADFWAVEFI